MVRSRRSETMSNPSMAHRRIHQVRALLMRAILILVLLTWLLGRSAQAAVSIPIAQADAWVTNGSVDAIALSDNKLYLTGSFTSVGPFTGGFVAIDQSTGNYDTHFPQVNGSINVIAPDGVGGWFIGGQFSAVGGVSISDLAHINADMTVDPNWNPSVVSDPQYYGSEVIEALAVSGTTVYVGGHFISIGGQLRNRLAALDAATGRPTPWNPDANGGVLSLAV